MSDDCFCRATQEQLSQCCSRNTATVLRAVVKSHKGLKGTKVFACGCSGRNLNNFSKFTGKSPCWGNVVALETLTQNVKVAKGCSVNFIKKEAPIQRLLLNYFPVSF